MSALETVLARIAAKGPITVAEFMEIALYDEEHGYYARASQRSGRGGDFYTSVDVGPLFGEMLAVQIADMWRILGGEPFDVVEAAAGNGRLTADVLDTLRRESPDCYAHARVTLVERSAPAREAQRETLARHSDSPVARRAELPDSISGVIFANELLDAFPVHVVVGTPDGAREVFVDAVRGALREVAGDPSPAAQRELDAIGVAIPGGVRAEVCPAAREWISHAAARLTRGFLLLIDYGHAAEELFSVTHAGGTLMSYRSHTADMCHWLESPGEHDLTSHVNLTTVRQAAEEAGLKSLGMVDQTYFLLGLGLAERLPTGDDRQALQRRLAARTLMMPGALGSTMKVMAFSRGIAERGLRGLQGGRLT